jgi:CubicO group peptidase (beta-lactamase class C family)
MWVVPAAFLLTTVLATTATPNAVHLGLGAEQLQVRDDIVAPLRYQGTGACLDLAYTREAGRTSHRFDIVLSGAPALDRYGHRALGLRFGASYAGLFPVARSPRYGSWLVGGELDWNMALQYYAQWDEEHLYWLTAYALAPAVAHDVRLAPRLVGPLGIVDPPWEAARDGTTFGPYGLYLTPRELARLGQLVLDDGVWEDGRVVSETWVEESTRKHVEVPDQPVPGRYAYGYYWWVIDELGGFTANGHGGQYVLVVPPKDLVVVMTAEPDTDGDEVDITFEQFIPLAQEIVSAAG